MEKKDFVQLSRDEVKEMDHDLRFASGVLELFHGVCNDTVMNSDPVLVEAENRLFQIRDNLEEKLNAEVPA